MSRVLVVVSSLALLGVGASVCVAQCNKRCKTVQGSKGKLWSEAEGTHIDDCRRYAAPTALMVFSVPPHGGDLEGCEHNVQYRKGCETCESDCTIDPGFRQSAVAEAGTGNCDNDSTFQHAHHWCKTPKSQPTCHDGDPDLVFPPDHDV